MFTGIVQTKGTVISFVGNDKFRTLTLSVASEHLQRLNIGASIAINGVCLTVTKFASDLGERNGHVQFDIIDETLDKTNLGKLQKGEKVNLERSVTFGTELGGHIVSGHIHDSVLVVSVEQNKDNCSIQLQVDPNWMKFILYKGFVSINGCSLTVGEVKPDGFSLHLIPETLQATNLGTVKMGDRLNLEVDQQTYSIVRTVERYLANNK
ncbi:riboflavin synthase subunit alpha [Psychrosphaera algicola]|uniref:Riboflavin synthase n=1 Tax=Psychrosphaera algicola TaxID=3023714 RepID=A0ABT5F8K0_9GAMM|nr:riboflavin synthase subunit alpha [Psychrosphaera sp. G1-22]MDC2887864.1 riboflavin synthase subunit alpha [Psychrosphaera sp. G1-22]